MSQSHEPRETDDQWPKALDAMTAAPGHHKILLENDRVRVLDTTIGAGDTVPLHTHCWPCVMYVLGFSDFVRYDEHGEVLVDTRKLTSKPRPGEAMWSPPLESHTLHNVGSTDLRVISVELKADAPALSHPK